MELLVRLLQFIDGAGQKALLVFLSIPWIISGLGVAFESRTPLGILGGLAFPVLFVKGAIDVCEGETGRGALLILMAYVLVVLILAFSSFG